MALASADAQIALAGFLVDRVTSVLDDGDGKRLAGRNARDAAYAARLLVGAVDDLMRAGGTAAQDKGNKLQRCWRDVTIASSHAALGFERSAQAFTETLLS
jgi:alkylation response protein AidB-like acyl-CoA dehydrogenase